MKNIARLIAVVCMLAASGLILNGCGDASQKHVADAKGNLQEAGKDLDQAAQAANEEAKAKATADWQQFKNESDSKIADMKSQAMKLKEKIAGADKKAREKLTGDLNKAEAKLKEQEEKLILKSIEFDTDLQKFDASVATKNEAFKMEFKHDLDELGTAFKDLFRDNVK